MLMASYSFPLWKLNRKGQILRRIYDTSIEVYTSHMADKGKFGRHSKAKVGKILYLWSKRFLKICNVEIGGEFLQWL